MGNSSDDTTVECDLSESFHRLADNVRFVCYDVLTHIFVIVCVPGYTFTLIVLNRQTGTEKAYFYQLFLTGSKTFEMAVMAVFAYTFSWGGVGGGNGQLWFRRSFTLMWFTAKVSLVLTEIAMTTSLYLALSMAADRLFAIVRPVEYKTIRRRRHQYVALSLSLLIGISTTMFNVATFVVVPNDNDGDGGTYSAVVDEVFATNPLGAMFTHISSSTRIFGLLSLFLCNGLLVKNFRRRLRQVSKLVASQSSIRERSRNAKERTLVLLTLCQSAFCAFVILSEIVFYSINYTVPYFLCLIDIYAPVLNMVVELTYMAEVVAPFLVSDQMRQAGKKLIGRRTVANTQSGTGDGSR